MPQATISKWTLATMLFNQPLTIYLQDSNGVRHSGIVQSIEREDGSAESYNVTIGGIGKYQTIHVRTVD